jgi:hypothetical protein
MTLGAFDPAQAGPDSPGPREAGDPPYTDSLLDPSVIIAR